MTNEGISIRDTGLINCRTRNVLNGLIGTNLSEEAEAARYAGDLAQIMGLISETTEGWGAANNEWRTSRSVINCDKEEDDHVLGELN